MAVKKNLNKDKLKNLISRYQASEEISLHDDFAAT
jgi:hypothetical protein